MQLLISYYFDFTIGPKSFYQINSILIWGLTELPFLPTYSYIFMKVNELTKERK